MFFNWDIIDIWRELHIGAGKFQGRRTCSIVALIWGFRDCVGTHFLSQIFMVVDSGVIPALAQGWGLLTSCLHTITAFPHPLPVRSRSLPLPNCAQPPDPIHHTFSPDSVLLSASSHPTDAICSTVTTSFFILGGVKLWIQIFRNMLSMAIEKWGWKVSSSTSGILIMIENERNRNRKQPFLRNSSKMVVNRTTFRKQWGLMLWQNVKVSPSAESWYYHFT